jgi:hypothetical protein
MMDADFPAAHSMDTDWFAVDADGHIGRFDSSESGAVPVESQLEDPGAVWRRLCEVLPHCAPIYDLQGNLYPGPRRDVGRHRYADRGSDDGTLMFLASLDPVKRQISSGNAFAVEATSGAAVVFRRLTVAVTRRLHKDGHCLGCFFYWLRDGSDEDYEDDEPRARPAEIGLYDYGHPIENWIALPYGREMLPSRPVHIDQLPPALRDQVGRVRFDKLHFADTVHIQPCDQEEVACWEPAYLSADGKAIRRIPLNYVDPQPTYEEFYADMTGREREWLKGITIEPPPKR